MDAGDRMTPSDTPTATPPLVRVANAAMALCLAVMASSVFINVVLRYGFGSGVAASEEMSRLLFVWMVFIGATAAYPMGEHMAFTSLLLGLRDKPRAMAAMALLIRLLVLLGCGFLAWGAWQQVVVGMGSKSVVLGYPTALLPLPAFLCALAIGVMALWEIVCNKTLDLGSSVEVE
jgi:TRAP-type C4-dicarboxylate transport system permease small subunit